MALGVDGMDAMDSFPIRSFWFSLVAAKGRLERQNSGVRIQN